MLNRIVLACAGIAALCFACGGASDADVASSEAAASGSGLSIIGLPSGSTLFKEVPLSSRDRGYAADICGAPSYRTDTFQNWFELNLSSLTVPERLQLKRAISAGKAFASVNVSSSIDTDGYSYGSYDFVVGVGGYEGDVSSAHMGFSAAYAASASNNVGDETRTRSIAVQLPVTVGALDFSTSVAVVEAYGEVEAGCESTRAGIADTSLDTVTSARTGGYEAALWIAP